MAENILELVDDQDPVQKRVAIHRHEIATVIELMMEKIEIACCLEKLLANNGALIADALSSHDLRSVMNLLNVRPSKTHISTNYIKSNTSRLKKTRSMDLKNINSELTYSNLISLFHRNEKIKDQVQEMLKYNSPIQKEFLSKMRDLQQYIVQTLHTTASQERLYNKQLAKAWVNNERYIKKNAEMDIIHVNRVFHNSFKINEKRTTANKLKKQMKTCTEECFNNFNQIINVSEEHLTKTTTVSDERLEILSEQAKQTSSEYQSLLDAHLAKEKVLRVKRSKVESVLSNLLAKYDADVGELQAELEEEEDGYNDLKAKFDDLSEKFAEQTIQYDELMEEKQMEEDRLFEIKLFEFLKLRSARRIQKWWRAILARKRGRRKAKKGKGKKK